MLLMIISNYGLNTPEYIFMMKQKEIEPDKYPIFKRSGILEEQS